MEKMQATKGYVPVNGGEIYYEMAGDGETILLLHGLFMDSRIWEPVFWQLAKHYKAVRLDLRGFGKTVSDENPFTNYDDLKGVLDYLQIDKAHIVGLSLGATIALEFACMYKDKINSLTLCSSRLSREDSEVLIQDRNAFIELIQSQDMNAALELYEKMWLVRNEARVLNSNQELFRAVVDSSFKRPRQKLQPIFLQDMEQRIKEIQLPVFIMYGQHDYNEYTEGAAHLHEQFDQSEIIKFEHSAHLINLTEPDKFYQTVCDNLKQIQ